MREIKFRAWGSDPEGEPAKYHRWENICHCFDLWVHNENIIIEQFTGLKDSSGVDIYEGDICKFHIFTQELGENLGVYEGEKETTVEISISEFGIWLQGDSEENSGYALWFDGIHEESFEVIGNIHENKDLLT